MDKEALRKVQKIQLEMAKDIKRVCEENGIRYFLYRGTFLGAVRHKGVIPWDDDMDFGMLRPDYDKFCRIAPEKLGKEYCFQNWHTDENYVTGWFTSTFQEWSAGRAINALSSVP